MSNERTYIHAKDLANGDQLCPEGRVVRVRPGKDGCVFVEVLYSDGRLAGGHFPREDWVQIKEEP